jgi:hypothetical protein
MSNEKTMTEKESLELITTMIQKAKGSHFHENGTSAILWGSVVGFCGIFSFLQYYFNFNVGINVWTLAFVAIIPQVYLTIQEKKKQVVKTEGGMALDAVWTVYGISLFALVIYMNVVPSTSIKLLAEDGIELLKKNTATGEISAFKIFIPSVSSLLMIIYAFPTLVTGLSRKFKPMIYGAIACYLFFIVSLFTSSTIDVLLNGLAGIGNWLIPGLILRDRYNKARQAQHV